MTRANSDKIDGVKAANGTNHEKWLGIIRSAAMPYNALDLGRARIVIRPGFDRVLLLGD